jgi:hypothetical protein
MFKYLIDMGIDDTMKMYHLGYNDYYSNLFAYASFHAFFNNVISTEIKGTVIL